MAPKPSVPKATPQALGGVIDALARKQHLSEEQLADLSGVPRPTLSQIIQGRCDIDTDQLYGVAKALGMKSSELLGDAEDKTG